MKKARGAGGRTSGERELGRREAIASMGAGVFGAYGVGSSTWERFTRLARQGQQAAHFFNDAELATLRILADMVIPRDAKSGGATDAGAIDYMDFVVSDSGDRTKQQWHDGLRWFDEEATRRVAKPFVQGTEAERGQIVDLVAWPARAAAELRPQVDFFNSLRDLTASAFFSSRMGVEDLGYPGGVFNPDWRGAPEAALRELGVSYAEWDAKYGGRGNRGTGGRAPTRHRP
jgi:gluconate 2-dehydrogenase gamma chain